MQTVQPKTSAKQSLCKASQIRGQQVAHEVVDVLVIVNTPAEELLDMLDAYQNRPLLDGLNLGWICTNGASTNNVLKILNRLLEERHTSSVWHKGVCYKGTRGL